MRIINVENELRLARLAGCNRDTPLVLRVSPYQSPQPDTSCEGINMGCGSCDQPMSACKPSLTECIEYNVSVDTKGGIHVKFGDEFTRYEGLFKATIAPAARPECPLINFVIRRRVVKMMTTITQGGCNANAC